MEINYKIGGQYQDIENMQDIPAIYIVGVKIKINNEEIFCPTIVGETNKLKSRMLQHVNPFDEVTRDVYDFRDKISLKRIEEIYKNMEKIDDFTNKGSCIEQINVLKNSRELNRLIFYNDYKYFQNLTLFNSYKLEDFGQHGYLNLLLQLYKEYNPRALLYVKKIIDLKILLAKNFYFIYCPSSIILEKLVVEGGAVEYNNPKKGFYRKLKQNESLGRRRIENTTKKALKNIGIHTTAKHENHISNLTIRIPKDANIIFSEKITDFGNNFFPKIELYTY